MNWLKKLKDLSAASLRAPGSAVAKFNGLGLPAANTAKTWKRRSEHQLRHLSQAAILEESASPKFVVWTTMTASLTVSAFLVWASMTNIDEVSRASGEVVPSGFEQVVQHMDGGIVQTIAVKAGDVVDKDQLMVAIDDGATGETLDRSKSKLQTLHLTEHRLQADLQNATPDFSTFSNVASADIDGQMRIHRDTQSERASRQKIVTEQIAQKQKEIQILSGKLATVKEGLVSLHALHETRKTLRKQGLIAMPLLVQTEQDVIKQEGEAQRFKSEVEQARLSLSEYSERLNSIAQTARLEASTSLNATAAEIQQLQSSIEQLQRRLGRLHLRAPVRGIIKNLNVNTIGSVLKAGQDVLTIVPLDDELVAETQILPRDVGHIRIGQPVQVKVSAYDFARYGVVSGTLERISATTFADANGNRFYRGRIKLAQPYVGDDPTKHPIIPGMTVVADIQTGEKTVLDYLLKPVKVATATAFSER